MEITSFSSWLIAFFVVTVLWIFVAVTTEKFVYILPRNRRGSVCNALLLQSYSLLWKRVPTVRRPAAAPSMLPVKHRPADMQIAVFRRHVTIYIYMYIIRATVNPSLAINKYYIHMLSFPARLYSNWREVETVYGMNTIINKASVFTVVTYVKQHLSQYKLFYLYLETFPH
jgi:hypothetical protein